MSSPSPMSIRYTSSADRWRTLLLSNSLSMRRRGPVAFRPLVFRSWTLVIPARFARRGRRFPLSYSVLPPWNQRAADPRRRLVAARLGLRPDHALPDRDPAGKLRDPGDGRAAQARPDP